MAFTKHESRLRTTTVSTLKNALPHRTGRLQQLRMAELDHEFARQARELAKLTRDLRNKLRHL